MGYQFYLLILLIFNCSYFVVGSYVLYKYYFLRYTYTCYAFVQIFSQVLFSGVTSLSIIRETYRYWKSDNFTYHPLYSCITLISSSFIIFTGAVLLGYFTCYDISDKYLLFSLVFFIGYIMNCFVWMATVIIVVSESTFGPNETYTP